MTLESQILDRKPGLLTHVAFMAPNSSLCATTLRHLIAAHVNILRNRANTRLLPRRRALGTSDSSWGLPCLHECVAGRIDECIHLSFPKLPHLLPSPKDITKTLTNVASLARQMAAHLQVTMHLLYLLCVMQFP